MYLNERVGRGKVLDFLFSVWKVLMPPTLPSTFNEILPLKVERCPARTTRRCRGTSCQGREKWDMDIRGSIFRKNESSYFSQKTNIGINLYSKF